MGKKDIYNNKKNHEYYYNIAKTNIPNNNSENIYIYL